MRNKKFGLLVLLIVSFQLNTISNVYQVLSVNLDEFTTLYDGDFNLKPKQIKEYSLYVNNPPMIIEINITVIKNPNYSFNYVGVNLSSGFIHLFGYSRPFDITEYEDVIAEETSFGLLDISVYCPKFLLMNQTNYYIVLKAGNLEGSQGHLTIKDMTKEIMGSNDVNRNEIIGYFLMGFLFLLGFSVILIPLVIIKRKIKSYRQTPQQFCVTCGHPITVGNYCIKCGSIIAEGVD